MPPLHPAIVHFPIALVVVSLLFDLLGRWFNKESLRGAAFWCLIGALLGGAAAAASGYYDYSRDALGDTSRYVQFHMYVGWVLVACVITLTIWRWRIFAGAITTPIAYLIAAIMVAGLTLFQGWYGGEMVYSQGAGVAAASKGTEPAINGKERLDKITPTK
jgi:uncharacterized membrane protein